MVGIECLSRSFKSAEGWSSLIMETQMRTPFCSEPVDGSEMDDTPLAYEFVLKLAAGHVLVSCGEEEAVGYGWSPSIE